MVIYNYIKLDTTDMTHLQNSSMLLPVFSFKSMMHCSLFYFLAAVYYDHNCLVNDQNSYYQSSVSICSLFI